MGLVKKSAPSRLSVVYRAKVWYSSGVCTGSGHVNVLLELDTIDYKQVNFGEGRKGHFAIIVYVVGYPPSLSFIADTDVEDVIRAIQRICG